MNSVVARGQATTVPDNAPLPHQLHSVGPLPCFVILVHGVNDVGEAYTNQERGLCEGLNERLDRSWDIQPGTYKVPSPKDKLEPNPDAVYYRRQAMQGEIYSPVIPFYWGFREEVKKVNTTAWHGEYLDRDGNRLDKDGAKNGGPFANATTNLVDFWSAGWNSFKKTLNAVHRDPVHPLLDAPHRGYMVLAALRLAMVIRIIRKRHPAAAINLVAHSQGCMVSLVANAFLLERNERPADGLIMNNPPYSLEEPWEEAIHKGGEQQTSHARIETLKAIISKLFERRATSPTLDELQNSKVNNRMASRQWGLKPNPYTQAMETFTERDNRGKVHLYFSPEDATVAMVGVMGIGWQGVPDTMEIDQGDRVERKTVLGALGAGFHQRVFTELLRNGKPVPIGLPPHSFLLRQEGDAIATGLTQHTPPENTWRWITGEALSPAIRADLHAAQSTRGQQDASPLDAAVAITNGGVMSKTEVIDDPRPEAERKPLVVKKRQGLSLAKETLFDTQEIERVKGLVLQDWLRRIPPLNDAEAKARTVWLVYDNAGAGKLWISRTETPDEARYRWQHQQITDSYHSAIVGNPSHSKYVTTYDLAIGAPVKETEEQAKFRIYLCEVADWRKKDPSKTMEKADPEKLVFAFFTKEDPENKALIEATGKYYRDGTIPLKVVDAVIPKLVVQETTAQRTKRATEATNWNIGKARGNLGSPPSGWGRIL